MSLAERLRASRKDKKISMKRLAELVGVSQAAIAKIEGGSTSRSAYIEEIANILGVSAAWLQFGERNAEDSGLLLSEIERELILKFRSLNSEDKDAVEKVMEAFAFRVARKR